MWPLGENYFSKRDSEPARGRSLSLSISHSEDNIDYSIWSSDTEFNTSPITPAEPTRMVVNNLVCSDNPNREECQEPEAPPPNRGTIVEVDGMDMTGPRSEECQEPEAPTPPNRGTIVKDGGMCLTSPRSGECQELEAPPPP